MAIEFSEKERLKVVAENCWLPHVNAQDVLKRRRWTVYTEGHGIYLRDSEGKEYIDAASGNNCTSLGHGNRQIIEAIKEQLDKVQYTTPGRTDVSIRLCQRIAEITPGDLNHVYLGLHGSDANEAALATARSYFRVQGKQNSIIVSRWLAFHGQSRGVSGITSVWKGSHGLDTATINYGVYHLPSPYCYRCPYGLEHPSCGIYCAQALDEMVRSAGPDSVAAFIGEPVFGSGGAISPPDEYWPMIRQICDKHGILLILDEVITGFGRTGKLFASEHWNIVPDMMTLAKGLTGAYLPLSAVVGREHVCKTLEKEGFPYGGHTHTFYPAGAACALAAIAVIMEGRLWENAAKVGAQIKGRLEKICQQSEIVGTVHGLGLHLGLEIVEDKASKTASQLLSGAIFRKCKQKGVVLGQIGGNRDILSICPPIIITSKEADQLCDVLSEAITEVEGERSEKVLIR